MNDMTRRGAAVGLDDLPPFLRPAGRTPRGARGRATTADESGGAAPAGRELPGIRMIGQHATNWCWSAVVETVNQFFDGRSLPQEEIATRHIAANVGAICHLADDRQNNRSCGDGGACQAHCNDFHRVRVVLDEHGHFGATLTSEAPPSFQQIVDEIQAGRPLVCRVQWRPAGGHFILVAGWTRDAAGAELVHVFDPKQNEGGAVIAPRVLPYRSFATAYTLMGNTGAINFSYTVK